MNRDDALRQLDKLASVLTAAVNHHVQRDTSNAHLHMSAQVLKSPLTVALERSLDDLTQLRNRVQDEGVA